MLVIFPAVVYCCVNQNLPDPSFKGIHFIGIGGSIAMDFFKDLEKAVVKDFNGVFSSLRVAVADRHTIAVERVIDFFLTLSLVQGAAPDMFI